MFVSHLTVAAAWAASVAEIAVVVAAVAETEALVVALAVVAGVKVWKMIKNKINIIF